MRTRLIGLFVTLLFLTFHASAGFAQDEQPQDGSLSNLPEATEEPTSTQEPPSLTDQEPEPTPQPVNATEQAAPQAQPQAAPAEEIPSAPETQTDESQPQEPVLVEDASPDADEEGQDPSLELTVTGSRVKTDARNLPADIKTVNQERLRRPGTKSALTALSEIPGVKMNPRQENSIFNDFEIRGLSGNSTSGGNALMLLDGIPQRRLSFGGPYYGALPYDAVTRVELVKGPTASLYGRNALAGAVQLFTDPGSPTYTWDVSLMGEIPTNTVHAAVKSAGPVYKNPIGSATELSTYSLTGSFTYAGGWQPLNESSRGDVYLHTELNLSDDDTLTVLAGFFDAAEEAVAPVFVKENGERMPNFDRDTNLAVPGQNSLDLKEYRLGVRYTRDWLAKELLQSKLTAAYWHGDTLWKVGRPSDQPSEGTQIARSASDRGFYENGVFTELEFNGKYDAASWLSGAWNLGTSFEYLTYKMTKVDITTAEAMAATNGYGMGIPLEWYSKEEPGRSNWVYSDMSIRDTYERNVGLFLRKQFQFIERITVFGGARFDTFDRTQKDPDSGDEANRGDWALSPSVGVNGAVLKREGYKVNLYANYGQGFSPIFRAVNNTMFADVNPETSESFDVGAKTLLFHEVLEFNAAYYQLWRRDIVAMNSETKEQENSGDWLIRGFETDVRVRPIHQLDIYANYAYRDPTIKRYRTNPDLKNNQIPNIAKHVFTAGTQGRADFGLGGGTEFRYVGEVYGNEANSFTLPDYLIWDAWISYDHEGMFNVALFAKNILDWEYYSAAFNGVNYGSAFEGTPRSFGISLSGHFE